VLFCFLLGVAMSLATHAAMSMCLSRVQLGGGTPITVTPGMSVNMKAPLERSGRLSLICSVSVVYFNLFLFAFHSVLFSLAVLPTAKSKHACCDQFGGLPRSEIFHIGQMKGTSRVGWVPRVL